MAVRINEIKLGTKLKVVTPRRLPKELKTEKGHILQVHYISDAFGLDTRFTNFNEAIILKVDNLNTKEFESVIINCKNKRISGVKLYKGSPKIINS